MKVLIFAPHPDDDIIGCGGSIAKHVKEKNHVSIVYLTSGEVGSIKFSTKQLLKIREREAIKAAETLGVHDLLFLKIPDGYIQFNKNTLAKVTKLIREKKPNLVYLPHKNEASKDHLISFELINEAIKRASGPWFQECKNAPWSVGTVLCYEVWTPLTNFMYTEDISEFMSLKIKALEQHKSQLAYINYKEAVKGLNRYRGVMTGNGKFCECFKIIKINKI